MIVKNEASNICGALESVRSFADDIVVVDTGSTDGTPELARGYTPRVFTYAWHDDFAAARNFSLEKARGAYCLWLDADDRVDGINAAKINALKQHFDGLKAFAFELQDFRNGSLFRSLMQIRCVPNRKDVRFRGRVHECIDWESTRDEIRPMNVDIVITHHGYDDPALVAKKITRNIRLLQMERQCGRDDATLHYYLATSYSHLGNSRAAMEHMGRVIDLRERKRFGADFREAESLKIFWLDAHFFLAKEMIAAGNRLEARRLMVKLQCAEAQDPVTLFRMAELHQLLEEHRDALRVLGLVDPEKQLPTVLPTPRITHNDLVSRVAFSLFALGRREEAEQYIQSLTESGARKAAWEAIGLMAVDCGHDALAGEALYQALKLGELTAQAWDQWGVVWKRAGNVKKAEACWRKALHLDPWLESAAIHLANLLWQSARKAEAYQIFKGLVDNGCCKMPVLLSCAVLAFERGEEEHWDRVKEGMELWLREDADPRCLASSSGDGVFSKLSHVLEREGKRDLAKIAQRLDQREKSKALPCKTV